MKRRTLLGAAVLAPLISCVTPAPASAAGHRGGYYTGDYKTSLNLYSFNLNLNSWMKDRDKPPPIDTLSAVSWAQRAGFDGVDVTAYYIPGYQNFAMPSKPVAEIMAYARSVRDRAEDLGIAVTGSGALNDFADADPAVRELDLARVKFWIEVAAQMSAPVFRVFSGVVPPDLDAAGGWEGVAKNRIAPLLREVTVHAATKGVKVVLQNHGDMTATADQTIQLLEWVDHDNIAVINDTGYFRPFQSPTGEGYDWYRDIAKCLPYTASIQVKRKPAGSETAGPIMDFIRLFTDLRLSAYRGFVPMERLWHKDDPDNPRNLSAPPYEANAAFLAELKQAHEATKQPPFDLIRSTVLRTHELEGRTRAHLLVRASLADAAFRVRRPADAVEHMEAYLRRLAAQDIQPAVRERLALPMTSLRLSFHDVFGV